MSFSGTQDKCNACDKTVHICDLLTADGVPYHKTCFKCSHCKGNLTMCSYSSMDGVLYCKPHFEQLFKETGSFSKKFHTPPKSENKELSRAPSKVSSMFSGTQEKCAVCNKTVYPLEKITVEGEFYHKTCFKCSHGGCILTTSNYAALNGILYCKHHFAQLFMEKGSYNHLIKTASMRKNSAEQVVPPELDLTVDPAAEAEAGVARETETQPEAETESTAE
ncbi:LIM domain-containing protein WLIM2b-like [Asparagus officinalis]|uniref:LIM domain-containing protein WLIM2b-like n=1 Tax=Asparagus officinalis TaxID=4686 RepID=UPI00098DF80C|nr:LIM domain-containing protein WLIM2b-like [Asparagus officinalis]